MALHQNVPTDFFLVKMTDIIAVYAKMAPNEGGGSVPIRSVWRIGQVELLNAW